MTTYNGSRFLRAQLESLRRQVRRPDEVVVCDDGSTDATLSLLQGFASSAPFPVRVLTNERTLGYSKNFEKALSLCTGDLISLCDQDDVWLPEKLERLEKVFAGSPSIGLAFSDSDLIDEAGGGLGCSNWQRLGFDCGRQEQMREAPFELLLHGPCVTGMSMMLRSALCSRLLPIAANWHHDAWIALLVSLLARIELVNKNLQAYRVHSAQQTYAPPAGKVLRFPRLSRAGRYREGAERYEAVKARLQSWNAGDVPAGAVAALDGKIAFMRDRARAYTSPFWWPVVLRQWSRGGYRRYGSGLRGALGDLLRLGNPTKNEN